MLQRSLSVKEILPDFLERNFCGFQELTTSSLIVFKVLNQHTNQNIGSKKLKYEFHAIRFSGSLYFEIANIYYLDNSIQIAIRIMISNNYYTYFTIAWWVAIWGFFILMFCDFLLLLSQHKNALFTINEGE